MYKGIANLTTPADSDGKLCGVHQKDHPYLYFVSPHADVITLIKIVNRPPSVRLIMSNVLERYSKMLPQLHGQEMHIQPIH